MKARAIFSCYRRDEAQDPDGFVANLAIVLGDYPAEIVDVAADPRTGIITVFPKGLPNVGQIGEFLADKLSHREKLQRLAALPKPDFSETRAPRPTPGPGGLANVFVPSNVAVYSRFMEKAKTANEREYRHSTDPNRPGIYVSLTWFDQPAAAGPKPMALSDDDLRKMYPVKSQETDAA